MGGITGFVGPFPAELLQQMTLAMPHRAQDGHTYWFDAQDGVGLGHARLAFLETATDAAQPMLGVGGRYVTVFSGEIYNYKALASDLKRRGYKFNEKSDVALLAPLFDCYGSEMLSHLNGMFSFAIWDKKEHSLFAARDHAGMKPFYYSLIKEGFLFASELKALLQCPALPRQFDHDALLDTLVYTFTPNERTLLQDIRKLPPGHFLTYSEEGFRVKPWFAPPLPELNSKGVPQYRSAKPDALLELFDDVVRQHAMSNASAGTLLSGGVDSSAILASLMAQDKRPTRAFCLGFTEPSLQKMHAGADMPYARTVSKHLGVTLEEIVADNLNLDTFSETLFHTEEPSGNASSIYIRALARHARAAGVQVLLSGNGADNLFSGYTRHQTITTMHRLRFLPERLRESMAQLAQQSAAKGLFPKTATRWQYMLGTSCDDALLNLFFHKNLNHLERLMASNTAFQFKRWHGGGLYEALQKNTHQHPLNRLLQLERHSYLPDNILNNTEKAALAEDIEIRMPFLDKRLMQFAARLPISQKTNGSHCKILLKKALEPRLPKAVLYRPRAGMTPPILRWLTQDNKDLVQDTLLSNNAFIHQWVPRDALEGLLYDLNKHAPKQLKQRNMMPADAQTVLTLLAIELWCQHFARPKAQVQKVA